MSNESMNGPIWIDELISWISSFDNNYSAAIVPAGKEDIERFETLLIVDLPSVYLEFLHRMGRYDGGLFTVMRTDANIESVYEYCCELKNDYPLITFTDCIPFALGDVFEGLGFHMGYNRQEPPIVFLEDGKPETRFSESLPVLCFQQAFLYECAAIGVTASYESFSAAPNFDIAHQLLSRAGFVKEWFSDGELYCARRGGLLLTGSMGGPGGSLQVSVSGSSQADVLKAGNMISRMLQGRFWRLIKEPTLSEVRKCGGAQIQIIREEL